MYNYQIPQRMCSPTSEAFSRNLYGGLPLQTAASTSNFYNPTTTSTIGTTSQSLSLNQNLSSSIYGLNQTSPLPRRRYSIGGLPTSSSIADYLNLQMQESAANVNITNLLNETCKSISRSSNILNRRLSEDLALSNSNLLCDLFEDNINSDIIKYEMLNDITTTTGITPTRYTNYYSQPTLINTVDQLTQQYRKPTLTSTNPFTSSYFNNSNARNLLYPNRRLLSDDYLLSKPIFSRNYLNNSNNLASSYLQDDYHTPFSSLSQTKRHLLSHHYASNPCLSQTHSHPYGTSNYNYNRYLYQSQPQPPPTRQPSISSLNRYAYSNYKDFVQPYYRTSSRLDLDNTKSNEIKRQVSFKFDVDTMSIDS
jgi:hypothetical protein